MAEGGVERQSSVPSEVFQPHFLGLSAASKEGCCLWAACASSLPTLSQARLPLPLPDTGLSLLSHCPYLSTPMRGCYGSCF